jgi:hypothetical protein
VDIVMVFAVFGSWRIAWGLRRLGGGSRSLRGFRRSEVLEA